MASYRVLVAARKDFWTWVEVEAIHSGDAGLKAIQKLVDDGWKGMKESDMTDIHVEAIEEMDDRPSKDSDEIWVPTQGE